jgi:hypothetical protein
MWGAVENFHHGKKRWIYYSNDSIEHNPYKGKPRLTDAPQTKAKAYGYMQVSCESWNKYHSRIPFPAKDEVKIHSLPSNPKPSIPCPAKPNTTSSFGPQHPQPFAQHVWDADERISGTGKRSR